MNWPTVTTEGRGPRPLSHLRKEKNGHSVAKSRPSHKPLSLPKVTGPLDFHSADSEMWTLANVAPTPPSRALSHGDLSDLWVQPQADRVGTVPPTSPSGLPKYLPQKPRTALVHPSVGRKGTGSRTRL